MLALQVSGALAATTAPWPRRWPTPYAAAGGRGRRPSVDAVTRLLNIAVSHNLGALRRWGVALYQAWENAAANKSRGGKVDSREAKERAKGMELAKAGRTALTFALGGEGASEAKANELDEMNGDAPPTHPPAFSKGSSAGHQVLVGPGASLRRSVSSAI